MEEGIVKFFWEMFGRTIPEGSKVFVNEQEIDPKLVKDVMENSITKNAVFDKAFFFFVDLEPEANWAHDCAYVFITENHDTAWIESHWPPKNLPEILIREPKK